MHIAIAGNIGSGKSTLTKMLAKRYGWKANFEPVDNNPYLADYYKDMERWSFNLQIYFLNKRFHDVVEISRSEQTIVQDRTIFEDARIFAPNLHDIGMMSDRDFKNYTDLFDLMISLVKLPDLMIYIKSSIPTLVKHIEKRGRDFEKSIRIDYLQGLNKRYEDWVKDYKGRLIIIDGDNLEFGENPEDFRKVTDLIDAELFGLFAEKEEDDDEEEEGDKDDEADNDEADEDREREKSSLRWLQIQSSLDQWCDNHGYKDTSVNMPTLSNTLDIPRYELTQFFAEYRHTTFRIWLSEIRLNAAKKMMQDYPDYSNDIISSECGFSSRSYLYKIFKEKEGCTPNLWRSKNCQLSD